MMKKFFLSCLTGLVLASPIKAQLPDNYQALSGIEKQTLLWNEVQHSHDEDPLPELKSGGFWAAYEKLTGLFSLSPSFDHVSDELPAKRTKILHPNGSVAKIRIVPHSGHPFTGLFKTGTVGIARLSLATSPSDDSYIPGMAVKFLMNDRSSLNIHVMNSLEGQGSNWNFFEKAFSNKIDHAHSFVLKAIEKIFNWTKSPANELFLTELATWDNMGDPVDEVIVPEQIYFVPAESVKHIIIPESREDFRVSLERIPMGAIYELHGVYQNKDYLIGQMELESPLLASHYGDEVLFFQHQR